MPRKPPFKPTLLSRAVGITLREVMTESAGSVQAFCVEHDHERRNLSRILTGQRELALSKLYEYLDQANVDASVFTLRVADRMRDLAAQEKQRSPADMDSHRK